MGRRKLELTPEQLAIRQVQQEQVKAIKRANRKMKYVASKYGKKSNVYKELSKQWSEDPVLSSFTNKGKDGIVQISTKLVTQYHNADKKLILWQIENTRGITEIESAAREFHQISRDEWKQLTNDQKKKYVSQMSNLEKKLRNKIDALYNEFGKGRKTVGKYMPTLMENADDGHFNRTVINRAIREAESVLNDEERLKKELLTEDDPSGHKNPTANPNKKKTNSKSNPNTKR